MTRALRSVLLLVVAALAVAPAPALEPGRRVSQYRLRGWDSSRGLPSGQITSLAQTADGNLWVGTIAGVVRFDGSVFTPFSSATVEAMRDDYVVCLLATGDGALWAGTAGGLLRWRGDEVVALTTADGLPGSAVLALAEGQDGRLWVLTTVGLGVVDTRRMAASAPAPEVDAAGVREVLGGRNGAVWAVGPRGLVRLDGGPAAADQGLPPEVARAARSLAPAADGEVLVAAPGRLVRLGGAEPVPVPPRPLDGPVVEDRHRALWFGPGTGGLCRFAAGQLDCVGEEVSPILGAATKDLLEDRDGSLWVATDAGLVQLADAVALPVSLVDGVPVAALRSVGQGRSGTVWLGGYGGVVGVGSSDPLPGPTVASIPAAEVVSVLEDRSGRLWAGSDRGLLRQAGGRVEVLVHGPAQGAPSQLAIALAEDPGGGVWVGTRGSGLLLVENGVRRHLTRERDGLTDNLIGALAVTPDGVVWAGGTAGLNRVEGETVTTYSARDGLPGDYVLTLHLDDAGTLWVGTTSGLGRLRDGRLASVVAHQGLPSNWVAQILDDDAGRLWLSTREGIAAVRLEELEAVASGAADSLAPLVLTEADGLRTRSSLGTVQPAGCRLADGRLAFVTDGGLAVVDPRRPRLQPSPPAALVEAVVVDGLEWAPSEGPVVVPPGGRSVEVSFNAPSLLLPERLAYRARLDGFDEDWVNFGPRRTKSYTGLPPGRYRFRVQARVGDGEWGPEAAPVAIVIRPRFHQTWWFRGQLVAIAGVAVAGGVRLRLRYLESRRRELEALVAVRTAELAEANALLARLATEDPLTGVANRRRFFELADLEWRRASRDRSSLAVVMLDVDHFKRFNDACGHPAGDRCLQAVARVLAERLRRAGDVVARYGGEEFITLLSRADLSGASQVAEELRLAVAATELPDPGPDGSHRVTVSLGCAAVVASVGGSLEELIAVADQALYRAKAEGRNRTVAVQVESNVAPGA